MFLICIYKQIEQRPSLSVRSSRITSFVLFPEELPENDGGTLLLGKEFFRNCKAMFSGPTNALETRAQGFPVKHLNILDPLKDNNNLGRSVNKGSLLFCLPILLFSQF